MNGTESSDEWTAQIEPFDSFWEGPEDIEKGYSKFYQFYKHNYLRHMPESRSARILVISCGPGYFVNLLKDQGYTNVLGIDSDGEKVRYATERGLDCEARRALPFVREHTNEFDSIFCEQEINHLTKQEMLDFLKLCHRSLRPGGKVIVHSLNGANPITGSESLAQNFDHYNTCTEYTLLQVLKHTGFSNINVLPLKLYVFYRNPLNYVLIAVDALLTLMFRMAFVMYGKSNKIFTKKIFATGVKA